MKKAPFVELLAVFFSDASLVFLRNNQSGSDCSVFALSPPAGYRWGAATRNAPVRDSGMLQAVQLRRWCSHGQHCLCVASGNADSTNSTASPSKKPRQRGPTAYPDEHHRVLFSCFLSASSGTWVHARLLSDSPSRDLVGVDMGSLHYLFCYPVAPPIVS